MPMDRALSIFKKMSKTFFVFRLPIIYIYTNEGSRDN